MKKFKEIKQKIFKNYNRNKLQIGEAQKTASSKYLCGMYWESGGWVHSTRKWQVILTGKSLSPLASGHLPENEP